MHRHGEDKQFLVLFLIIADLKFLACSKEENGTQPLTLFVLFFWYRIITVDLF